MANGRDPDGLISERGPEGSEFLRLIEERERLLKQLGGSDVFSDVVLSQIRRLRPDQAVAFLRKNRDTPQNLRFAQPPRTMRFEGDRTRTVSQKARDLRQLLEVQEATAGGAAQVSTRAPGGGEPQGLLPVIGQLLEAAVDRDREMSQEMEEAGVKGEPGLLGLLLPTLGGVAGGARAIASAPGEARAALEGQRLNRRLSMLDRSLGGGGLGGLGTSPVQTATSRIDDVILGIAGKGRRRLQDQGVETLGDILELLGADVSRFMDEQR